MIPLLLWTFLTSPLFAASDVKVSVFLSKNCPCSQSHETIVQTLANEYKEFEWRGVHANADEIDSKEKIEASKTYFKSRFNFPVYEDLDQKETNRLKALKTPHVFIEKNGKIIYSGGVDDSHSAPDAKVSYLKTALSQIRAGQNPEPSTTRALGCMIKRKK